MGLKFEPVKGQTPIDADEARGLLIDITTQAELDEFEHINIQQSIQWMLSRRFKKDEILTEDFIRRVHAKMYGDVWSWAGDFRKSEKNIGITWYRIPESLKALLDDCKTWINNTVYVPDEIAIRFKHRIVQVHCFPNGNGRHSRMMADLIIEHIFNRPVFTWGGAATQLREKESRDKYIASLKAADNNNIEPLLKFARTNN